jgi:integrase
MPGWRLTRLRGELALTFEDDAGKRRRFRLGTSDPSEAKRLAPAVYAELNRPKGTTVADLWEGYRTDKEGRSIAATMKYTWKALGPHFGRRPGEAVTQGECRSYVAARRASGISDGSIHTELGHLRTVLVWAKKRRLIAEAPDIERPAKPAPKDRYLTRDEARKMLDAANLPHVRLAMHLMLATAARVSAVTSLTWDRVDMQRRLIHLADPDDKARRKGRAVVPINDTLFAALQTAKAEALSDYVVEWGSGQVKSIKRSISSAAERAGLEDVSPHVFRHTAAVWMAEAGIPMSEISQYLGHTNLAVTIKVYARYSPDHLRAAAKSLEMGIYEVPAGQREPVNRNGDGT